MEIKRKDLAKLNTVFWYYDGLGEAYSVTTTALRDIYYFCERKLDEEEGVAQPEKPVNHRPKVSHREKVHGRLAAGD